MVPRKQLDIDWLDLIAALRFCLSKLDRSQLERELDQAWKTPNSTAAEDTTSRDLNFPATLATLSVRSGFDATLTSLDWPPGSEVLVSAITIRDMPRILTAHGLRVIPVDLDMSSLSVSVETLRNAVTPQTRGILVAHLFGARMPMQPIVDFARKHGLFVFEDCAQAFTGTGDIRHPESDVRMFSFGPIKTATALGGAVLSFRDSSLRDRIRAVHASWPIQRRFEFMRRVARFAMIKAVSFRSMFTLFAGICRWLGRSHDDLLTRGVRGFAEGDLLARIRRQPSGPLLSLLSLRLKQNHGSRIERRRRLARELDALLPDVDRPGRAAVDHSFWVYPIHYAHPDELVQHLWRRGFDATRGASSMGIVESSNRSQQSPQMASESIQRVLYLPFDPAMTRADLERLVAALGR
jgi:perosamine synthetase